MSKNYLEIELTEEEIKDAVYWITALNTTMDIITRPLPTVINKEQAQDFYNGVCHAFADAKVLEHLWRCEISKKYNVDYAVGFDNGKLYTEDN